MKRVEFLRSLLGVPFIPNALNNADLQAQVDALNQPTIGNMIDFSVAPIQKVRIGIIGMGNRGNTLLEMCQYLVQQEKAVIVGLCDLVPAKTEKAGEKLAQWQNEKPRLFSGNDTVWKDMVRSDDIDLILITTPWSDHTPMSIFSMEHGKHVACEVPIAYSLKDCWSIAQTAERTQRHCIMLENCCYNEEELWLMNMVQEGVFGSLTHAEGAYLHDLRAHMLSTDYYQNQWRLHRHEQQNGNLYTTHGLGPISMYMNIGRGDAFSHLVSMSSKEQNLSSTADRLGIEHEEFICGDINTTLIKTEQGRTIMLQFDTHTGRPYSRINKLVGTKAVHDGYPSRLYLDKEELAFWGHMWLPEEEYKSMRKKYQHPMLKKLKQISQQFKQGHGGMDFVMMYRLIDALNNGRQLDLNVYDGISWSAITPLSEISVMAQSSSINIPDFSGGKAGLPSEHPIMKTF